MLHPFPVSVLPQLQVFVGDYGLKQRKSNTLGPDVPEIGQIQYDSWVRLAHAMEPSAS